MTDTREKTVSEKAIEFINELRRNAKDKEYSEREMLDYIAYILHGYDLFKKYCTKWEYCYYLEFGYTVEIKYKNIDAFDFMKRLTIYPWTEVITIY